MLLLNERILASVKALKKMPDNKLLMYADRANQSANAFGLLLIQGGGISREEIGKIIGDIYDLSYIALDSNIISHRLVRKFPPELCYKHNFIPIYKLDNCITVASCDPFNEALARTLSMFSEQSFSVIFSFSDEIRSHLAAKFKDRMDTRFHAGFASIPKLSDKRVLSEFDLKKTLGLYLS